jgi:heme o synthase
MIGTALMASGTAAVNQWYERDVDRLMIRTRGRPLPSGRLKPARALIFGMGVSFIGFVELGLGANALAGLESRAPCLLCLDMPARAAI